MLFLVCKPLLVNCAVFTFTHRSFKLWTGWNSSRVFPGRFACYPPDWNAAFFLFLYFFYATWLQDVGLSCALKGLCFCFYGWKLYQFVSLEKEQQHTHSSDVKNVLQEFSACNMQQFLCRRKQRIPEPPNAATVWLKGKPKLQSHGLAQTKLWLAIPPRAAGGCFSTLSL